MEMPMKITVSCSPNLHSTASYFSFILYTQAGGSSTHFQHVRDVAVSQHQSYDRPLPGSSLSVFLQQLSNSNLLQIALRQSMAGVNESE